MNYTQWMMNNLHEIEPYDDDEKKVDHDDDYNVE